METERKETEDTGMLGKWQEGIISYNGRKYLYNNENRIYLFLGIDKDDPVEKAPDYISGGQSDAMFLLVTNAAENTLSVVSINRNTMTNIETYSDQGTKLGTRTMQICLQHGYGDGMKLSCSLTMDAVSHLFYNLPIDGYLALNMGGIPMMNDSVGGVEVEVLQDLSYPDAGVELTAGDRITLNGTEAYYYLRGRDINEFDSATYRLRRQEQYITSYLGKLKEYMGNSSSKALDVYNAISDYLVTNMSATEIITELAGYDYDPERLYTVPGETVMGEIYEEYYVDEDALYDLIINVFYKEAEE